MGAPSPVRLIELGPGRGTLMSDALRAARIVPDFRAALDVWLIETSPTLAAIQHETLLTAGAPVAWVAEPRARAPQGPAIVIANEFLDALPVRQYVRGGGQWRERIVASRRIRRTRIRRRRDARALHPGARAEDGEVLEVNPGRAPAHVRTRRPRSSSRAAPRCSSITAMRSPASATRCRPCARTAWSTRSPSPATATSPPMSISPPWRAARAPPGRRFTARSTKAISCARSA